MTKISSISISGRITLNMHSLNNEGNEGNQVLTRQVTIIDNEGKTATVTAVSGDMLKHILGEHFWKIAKENELALSDTSKVFNANRIISKDLKGYKNEELKKQDIAMNAVIKTCALSDISGAIMTGFLGSWGLGGGLSMYKNTPMEKAIRICIIEAVKYIAQTIPPSYYKY